MKIVWKFWSDASNESKAGKHLQQVKSRFEVETSNETLEPYHKGGFVFSFETLSLANNWGSFVIETIAMGQKLGRGWTLNGNIYDDPDGWSNESNISGITSMQWMCLR